jgi:aspartate racemase
MKHIGLIGGISPESTIHYYKIICDEFNKRFGKSNFPDITIRSISLQAIQDLYDNDQWDEMAEVIIKAINNLAGASVDFVGITANTPHMAYEQIKKKSPLQILSIMDATGKAIQKDGLKVVGLLGTKKAMEHGFFQESLKEYGIDAITPDAEDREYVNKVVFDELIYGKISDASREEYKRIIAKLVEKGAQGIILGCTEIPMLIKPEDVSVKTYDTTDIHAKAILEHALAD